MATRAPSATNSRAVANPMPLLPPVIKAVLVLSFMSGVVIEHQFCRFEFGFLRLFLPTASFARRGRLFIVSWP
jgi:hypothetical protein